MNLLDRAISAINPVAGERRALARLRTNAIENARQHYDGASRGRRSAGWKPVGTSANQEIATAGQRLRNVSRDLYRNNAYARRIVNVIATNLVVTGITPFVVGQKDDTAVDGLLKRHLDTKEIDAAGRLSLYGIQLMVAKTVVMAGEALVLRIRRRSRDRLTLPFQIKVLDPEFLDETKDGPTPSGGFIWQGIEFDTRGRRVAYWIFDEHPANPFWKTPKSTRWLASDVSHVFRVDHPGQERGEPWLAPVIPRLYDLAGYLDAQLMRQRVAACFVAFMEQDLGGSDTDSFQTGGENQITDQSGNPIDVLEPGILANLKAGQKVKFSTPPQTNDFDPTIRVFLLEIAAGMGTQVEQISGDYSRGNFSNSRMGWMESNRQCSAWRSELLIEGLGHDIGRWTIEAAALVGAIGPNAVLGWTPPKREFLQPEKDIPALIKGIRGGILTRSEVIRGQGKDPADHDRENSADNARADKLKNVAFTSDGRLPEKGGSMPGEDDDEDKNDEEDDDDAA